MEEERNGLPYYEKKYDYYENRNYDTYDYMKDAQSINTREEPSTAAKVLLLLMAIFFNMLGAIIGAVVGGIYMNKDAQGYKSYGKVLLIISIVFLVLDILFWVFFFMLVSNYVILY